MRPAFLLGVLWLIVGCGSSGSPTYGGAPVPSALIGTWSYEVFGNQLCDQTNHCVPSYAHTEQLSLTRDGRFSLSRSEETNTSTCTLVVDTQGEGSAAVDGSTLLLYVDQGTTRNDDTCGQSTLIDERGNIWAYAWEVFGNQLMLTSEQGTQLGPFLRQPLY